jgi:hypothetical protein
MKRFPMIGDVILINNRDERTVIDVSTTQAENYARVHFTTTGRDDVGQKNCPKTAWEIVIGGVSTPDRAQIDLDKIQLIDQVKIPRAQLRMMGMA